MQISLPITAIPPDTPAAGRKASCGFNNCATKSDATNSIANADKAKGGA